MFAIVDVETTGGQPAGNAMTEIAILLFDGHTILDRFESLLNPQRPIPVTIQNLTGISDADVLTAPLFEDVAPRVMEILEGAVFVAHNVNFDLGFVRQALLDCGYQYQPQKLCSVRYTRKIVPGLRSYALGSLCRHFGIRNQAAHRAMGDARATTELLAKLLQQDDQDLWQQMVKRNAGELNLPPHLPARQYQDLPEAPGVYYFLDKQQKPLYIGKAKNLKKRVATHFTFDRASARHQAFKRNIHHLRIALTGSELVAGLLEDSEIRHYWPPYNSAQKKPRKRYGVFEYPAHQGQVALGINLIKKQNGYLMDFLSLAEAQNWLLKIVRDYDLDPALCDFARALSFDSYQGDHQANLQRLRQDLAQQGSQLLRTPGRHDAENGFVWMEQGKLRGYGYLPKALDWRSDWPEYLQPLANSITTQALLRSALMQEDIPMHEVAVHQRPEPPAPPGQLFA